MRWRRARGRLAVFLPESTRGITVGSRRARGRVAVFLPSPLGAYRARSDLVEAPHGSRGRSLPPSPL